MSTDARIRAQATAEALRGAAEAAAEIHAHCHRTICAGCEVRRTILAVLTSTADVIAESASTGFRTGRTYSCGPWRFRCDRVTTHPGSGTPVALGWIRGGGSGWSIYSYDLDQWSADWTDVTEAGDA